MAIAFTKMHVLGNDFVVIDARQSNIALSPAFFCDLADRHRGIGFDQIVLIHPSKTEGTDLFLEMYNADGSIVRAGGNMARCVSQLLFEEKKTDRCVLQTISGPLTCTRDSSGLIAVDMDAPLLNWDQIPLAHPIDTLNVALAGGDIPHACCVSTGNPHAVHFIENIESFPVDTWGPKLEHHPLFPDRCNIEFAQILSPTLIRMRAWERGAGITQACGTGACATLVAAVRRGLSERRAIIQLDGGDLTIDWTDEKHVLMITPATKVYTGLIEPDFFSPAPANRL